MKDPENIEDKGDIIAVDGFTASGTTSCCKALAQRIGYRFLDSGSIYRLITWLTVRMKLDPSKPDRLARHIRDAIVRIGFEGDEIALDGRVLGGEIRTAQISDLVPIIAEQCAIRALVRPIQHKFARGHKIVAEGRDLTSVVFPGARVRLFLDAHAVIRGERRLREYQAKDPSCDLTREKVIENNRVRDERDMKRDHSPLVKLPGIPVIETTKMTIEEVVEEMLKHCR